MWQTARRQLVAKKAYISSHIRCCSSFLSRGYSKSIKSDFALDSSIQELELDFLEKDELYKYVFGNDKLSPAAKVYVLRNKINTKFITPTGKKGMIIKEDVINYLKSNKNKVSQSKEVRSNKTGYKMNKNEDLRKQFDTEMKKRMATTMTDSKLVPCFMYNDEYDVTNLLEFEKNSSAFSNGISFASFVLKSISVGLSSFPDFNCTVYPKSLDEVEIRDNKHQNICIAHSESKGLSTTCIQHIESLKIDQIEKCLPDALDPKCEGDSSKDSTITLYFNYHGTSMYPNIIRPHSCAIAFGHTRKEGKFDLDNQLVLRDILQSKKFPPIINFELEVKLKLILSKSKIKIYYFKFINKRIQYNFLYNR